MSSERARSMSAGSYHDGASVKRKERFVELVEGALEWLHKLVQPLSQWGVVSHVVAESTTSDAAPLAETAEDAAMAMALELTDFTNAMHGLISRDPVVSEHVRLWSVPGPPFELGLFEDLCRSHTEAAVLGSPVRRVESTESSAIESKMQLTAKGNLLHKELV